ncbi:MAG: septum formation protein Maf [Candidatus Omnitrophica bacterium]|nr:septum formation protein Maf [Candidatus Omnitrophota bacterium]
MLLLYIASQSSRRKQLLKKMGIPFIVSSSNYHERRIPGLSPEELALKHARGKVRKAVTPKKARWVLGADTVVSYRNQILGKPKTRQEAVRMLKMLRGKWHKVITGLFLYDRKKKVCFEDCAMTHVRMKKLTDVQVKGYLNAINPFDKAGSYGIQEGPRIVKKILGSYTNVIGLPVEALRRLLRKAAGKSKFSRE